MINIGLLGFDNMISLEMDKYRTFDIYQTLKNLVKDNAIDLILIDKLFKKYLNQYDAKQAISLLINIRDRSSDKISYDEFEVISKIIRILNKLLDRLTHVKNVYNIDGNIRMIIFNIPYCAIDRMQPLEFYDSLTDEDEPFWMRDVSDFIQK